MYDDDANVSIALLSKTSVNIPPVLSTEVVVGGASLLKPPATSVGGECLLEPLFRKDELGRLVGLFSTTKQIFQQREIIFDEPIVTAIKYYSLKLGKLMMFDMATSKNIITN